MHTYSTDPRHAIISLISVSDRYQRARSSAPPFCYFCKNTVTGRRIERRSLGSCGLDAGRIRRKGSAISRSRTTHGKLRERQAARWDLTQHFYARLTARTSPPFPTLLFVMGLRASRARWCNPLPREVRGGSRAAESDKWNNVASPRVAPRVALRGVRPWNCNLIASPASRPRGSDCRSVGRSVAQFASEIKNPLPKTQTRRLSLAR